LLPHVKEKLEIREIPKGQRYVGRPSLEQLFKTARQRKTLRDEAISEAVNKHGYSQVELADFLGLHYSTISRLVNVAAKQQE
jgi:putative transposase